MQNNKESIDDPDGFYYYINGLKIYDEEKCVQFLLKEGVIFIDAYTPCRTRNGIIEKSPKEFATLVVNVNDIFVPASHCIPLEYDDIVHLYEYHTNPKYNGWGFVIWACEKIKEQPRNRTITDMKSENVWKDEYDINWEKNYSERSIIKETCLSKFLIFKKKVLNYVKMGL